jgi:DtxR family Mn-dependent transcriptional regulator
MGSATESWKAFEQNAVSHSVAHHLVAIAELLEEYGYARVSDVARRLEITRGSASLTLKNLEKKGLVNYDERRFLLLSAEGEQIARSIQARKKVMKRLFVDVLGVDAAQAELDTCMIEHLISGETADRTAGLLRFLESDAGEAAPFRKALARYLAQQEPTPEFYPPEETGSHGT